jgi:sugar phosphate permease
LDTHTNRFRWVIFASVLFTYLIISSQRTAPGLITDKLMADFSVKASTIGLVASIQFLVYTGLQIPMGILVDRYGPNLFLIFGAALTGIGTILYSLGTHAFILFFARILTGIGDATIWVSMVLILSLWFGKGEFPRLIGFAGMTGSLGFLLATVQFSAVIVSFGWRESFL